MQQEEFRELIQQFTLARQKSRDYATSDDVLSNFKRNGTIAQILRIPELWERKPDLAFALLYAIMKIDRIINIELKGGVAVNEAVEDSFIDLSNYLDLAYALFVESTRKPTSVQQS